jgi:large subunit ribosomal protein L25
MANQVKLSARPRVEVGRNALSKVRARGAIPAVLYGARDAATNLEIDKKDIQNLLSRAVGENILVDLEIREGATVSNRTSLIQEVQHHPVRGEIIHVDFHAVSMTEEIDAEVVLDQEPVGVKTLGSSATKHALVADPCLPQNPEHHCRGCLRTEYRGPRMFATSGFLPALRLSRRGPHGFIVSNRPLPRRAALPICRHRK